MPRFPLSPDEAAAVAYAVRLVSTLSTASGNVDAAAKALGIRRRTLDDHITRLGLRPWLTATYSRSDRQPRDRA